MKTMNCHDCGQELEFFEVNYLPGSAINDLECGAYHTGQNYWSDCYKKVLGDVKNGVGSNRVSGDCKVQVKSSSKQAKKPVKKKK